LKNELSNVSNRSDLLGVKSGDLEDEVASLNKVMVKHEDRITDVEMG
jgi:hypothetical protein